MRFLIPFIFLLLVTVSSYAQDARRQPISVDASGLKVEQFVKKIESITPFRFYFDARLFDSIVIDASIKDVTIDKALQQAFKNAPDVYYSIDPQNNIFLSRGVKIQTELPYVFFGSEKNTNRNASSNAPSIVDANAASKQRQAPTFIENKLYEIGSKTNNITTGQAVISGVIKNQKTGEPVINASIFNEQQTIGVKTDQFGYFSIALPKGRNTLNVQAIGLEDARLQVMLYDDGKLDLELMERVVSLKEVVVSSQKVVNINRVQQGVEKLSIQAIKQVPTVFGETDILRVVLTLPGVKTVGEASTGFNVRGGSADQNLILFNDATIYNPSHFFGLFSAFNPEVVKDIELFKSSIPAKFGGRLASVLNITSREGNKKEFSGTAGLGLLTSRINLEGPIKKDQTSFVFGARSTYANWLLKLLPSEYENSKASFYDVNLGVSHQLNAKNNLYFTGYISNDRFQLNSDTAYGYSNKNISVKWKHTFSNKLNAVLTAGADRYNYLIKSDNNPVNAYSMDFDINQLNLKSDFNYVLNSKHTFDFGFNAIRYVLNPGSFKPVGPESLVEADVLPAEHALESALYISDRYSISKNLSLEGGLRFSMFNYLGPQTVNMYAQGLPKEDDNLLEKREYGKGKFIKTYQGPEYRLAARYSVTNSFSIKASYNTQKQYIHMLSNTTAIAPTDVWKLSDVNIKPQQGQQVSLGLYKNFRSNTIETSLEVYYKKINNYLDYKPGASLVMNHTIETDVVNTNGKAYGAEVMVKKQSGKLNGWVSYTYSRILLKMDDPTIAEPVNGGKFYPANYDKPHDATLIGNFKVNHRFSVSLNTTYSTGRPITLPIARYYYGGAQRVLYSDRNQHRIPDYFRTDLSMNIEGNHKVNQKTHNSWTIGLYNVTGRRNAYSVYFVTENGRINGYKLSIFGSIIPFINYNIKF